MSKQNILSAFLTVEFTETNPDKGTERNISVIIINILHMFTETNPDKGTETNTPSLSSWYFTFTETNPDKGTETVLTQTHKDFSYSFTETSPDKGTETCTIKMEVSVLTLSLQKLTPIRGRKRFHFKILKTFIFVYRS